ncbi:MAG: type I-E CRISPR-associated protein Cse1/CasA [Candidatus Omnitrophota bacterium]|nr:type I-E CRISPR-associated protein Cse1/CasA [Candidatus Omnitrophota bacterium]
MNLIHDVWIPVRRRSGAREKIAPWEVTDKYADDPILELAAVRPDFNGALIQFLIGLLQTTCAPQGDSDWRKWLNNPPPPVKLKEKFESVALAFNLDGDGPRFMQDLTIESEEKKTTVEVDNLLIDAPGENALMGNTDFFVKRKPNKLLCQNCAAHAVLTLQLNSPEGGRGHLTGLRGGGPVSTIVMGNNLWATSWINVLNMSSFCSLACSEKENTADKFPWMTATRAGDKSITTSQDINPAQIYWSLPKRIRLIFKQGKVQCGLCGDGCDNFIAQYYLKTYGVKYKNIAHPLTPTYLKDNDLSSVHQREAVGYKFWSGYIFDCLDKDRNPAKVISVAMNRGISRDFRLWVYGYDMKKNKPKGWYEGVMPIISIEDSQKRKSFSGYVVMLILAADTVSSSLSKAVAKALNAGVFDIVRQRFWQETEAEFYRQLAILRDDVMRGGDGLSARQAWRGYLSGKAEDIFNDMSQADMIELVNAKRVAKAFNELKKYVRYGERLKTEILGLPK